jgi:hypothetical protein
MFPRTISRTTYQWRLHQTQTVRDYMHLKYDLQPYAFRTSATEYKRLDKDCSFTSELKLLWSVCTQYVSATRENSCLWLGCYNVITTQNQDPGGTDVNHSPVQWALVEKTGLKIIIPGLTLNSSINLQWSLASTKRYPTPTWSPQSTGSYRYVVQRVYHLTL